jgi:hypothetical protein
VADDRRQCWHVVVQAFTAAIERRGIPASILTDNGLGLHARFALTHSGEDHQAPGRVGNVWARWTARASAARELTFIL